MIEADVFAIDPDWSQPIRERTEYLTEILRMHDEHEQRIRLRNRPRRVLTYRVLALEPRDRAALAAQIFKLHGQIMGVPYWPDLQPLLADAGIGDTIVEVDTTFRSFAASGLVLLWRDQYTHEFVQIDTVNDDSLELAAALTMDWPADGSTYVIPLLKGRLSDSQTLNTLTCRVTDSTVTFECEDTELGDDIGDGTGPIEPDELHECEAGEGGSSGDGGDGGGDGGGGGGGGGGGDTFTTPGPEFGSARYAHRPTISLVGAGPASTTAVLTAAATFWHPAGLIAGDVVFAFIEAQGLIITEDVSASDGHHDGDTGTETTPTIDTPTDDMGNTYTALGTQFSWPVEASNHNGYTLIGGVYTATGGPHYVQRIFNVYYCKLNAPLAPGETLTITFGIGSGTSMNSAGGCASYGLLLLDDVVRQTTPSGGSYGIGPITISANRVLVNFLSTAGLGISPSSPPDWPLAIFSAGFSGTFGNPYVIGTAHYGNALGWYSLTAAGTYAATVDSDGVLHAEGGSFIAAFTCTEPVPA